MVTIEAWLAENRTARVLDVRSPGEFKAGHIPGAVNLPLFDDDERARVGTAYKQQSPEAALMIGLQVAGAHMTRYVEQARQLSDGGTREILVHCWRGGKRSEAMAWLLHFAGLPVRRIAGGYKAFRQAAATCFAHIPHRFLILGGCTGAGKTEIIQALAAAGEQSIDLEGLAHHKGSAFGSIGEDFQPSNEQFENELFLRLHDLDPTRPVWLENESKNIGRVYLPDAFWQHMRDAQLFSIEVDEMVRLERVISYYSGHGHLELLKDSFAKIRKRLGGLEYQKAIEALEHGNIHDAARIALAYYDKSYRFQLSQWPAERVIHLDRCENITETANRLVTASRFSF